LWKWPLCLAQVRRALGGGLSYAPAEGAYRRRTPNVLALLGSRREVDDVLDAAESRLPTWLIRQTRTMAQLTDTKTGSPVGARQRTLA